MKQAPLTYTFHNPNSAQATADFLAKLFVEVNLPNLEAAIWDTAASAKDPSA